VLPARNENYSLSAGIITHVFRLPNGRTTRHSPVHIQLGDCTVRSLGTEALVARRHLA